ncbi:hypothetical protein ACH4TX_08450 [Streptomyces sp. NPDC021098]|uniref:hypothetical protein n=1 Tax=unclassified Streptomyces TaxID=2593676 RepID=UPI0037968FC8
MPKPRRIPTIEENVAALEYGDRAAARTGPAPDPGTDTQTYREAAALTEAVLNLHPDVGEALLRAFRAGYLDIPHCLHPDNRDRTRSRVGDDGRLLWDRTGALPIGRITGSQRSRPVTSTGLLEDLSYMRRRFAEAAVEHHAPLPVRGTPGTGAG